MKKTAVIIDLETTGLDSQTDEIIEIGLMEISFDDDDFSILPRPSRILSELGEPKVLLSDFIKGLTGLIDEDLRGRSINWQMVYERLKKADYLIAHNAQFEKSFLDKIEALAGLSQKVWACSMTQINWAAKGSRSKSLNYVAADQGFLNPFPHRAPFDVITTFKVIENNLEELILNAGSPVVEVRAVGSDISTKDVLKARGYSWLVEDKVWRTFVSVRAIEAEREFLKKEVYPNKQDRHSENVLQSMFQ